MYNIEGTTPKINTPATPVIIPEGLIDEGGEKGQKGAKMPKMPVQVNPFEMPALSPEFSKEILAKLQVLKGVETMMNPIESVKAMSAKLEVPAAIGANPDGSANDMMVQDRLPPQVKNVNSLVPGQTFSAEILDVKQGSISLKMAEGGTLTARSLATPDARIGDMASFIVRETKPGQVFLEFLRGSGKVSASIVREALSAANMQMTNANAGIVEDLVTRNMPIDTSTLQRAAFFKYSMPAAPFEHIQFLVQNNFAPTERTVQMFTSLMSGEVTIQGEIAKAVSALEAQVAMPKTAQGGDWQGLLNQLKAYASVELKPPMDAGGRLPPLQDPNVLLAELKSVAQEIATQARGEGNTVLAQTAENIADIIDFSRNITENKAYFQLPFSAENQQLAELHVFKKKGGAGKRGDGKVASALIALDMAFLGRVEILVNKNDKQVNLQVRSDKDSTVNTVSLNILDLSNLLKDAGYTLSGLKTKKLTEKFDLTKTEQEAMGTVMQSRISDDLDDTPKRYSFDARV